MENLGLVAIYCNIILYHNIIVIQKNYHNLGWLLHPDLKVHAISKMTCKLQRGAWGKLGAPQDALRLPHWGVVVHCPMLLDLNISPSKIKWPTWTPHFVEEILKWGSLSMMGGCPKMGLPQII